MTYGENTQALRDALADLLTYRQPSRALMRQSRVTDDVAPPEEYSALIQRYRASILLMINGIARRTVPVHTTTVDPRWGPAKLFANRLEAILPTTLDGAGRPTHAELGTVHSVPLVEAWRRAAAAAAVATEIELDQLAGPDGHIPLDGLSRGATLLALRDAADLTRAVIALDARYDRVPGWQHLGGFRFRGADTSYAPGLRKAAELCREWASAQALDYDLDKRGHQPAPVHIPGPYPPGHRGAIDALHNTVQRWRSPLDARSLRITLAAQYDAHTSMIRLATDADRTDLVETFTGRRAIYRQLIGETMHFTGPGWRGDGVADDARTASILLADARDVPQRDLDEIDRLLTLIADQAARTTHEGLTTQRYLAPTGEKRLISARGGVRRAEPVRAPVDRWTHPRLLDLLTTLRPELDDLRPARRADPIDPAQAAAQRADFDQQIRNNQGSTPPFVSRAKGPEPDRSAGTVGASEARRLHSAAPDEQGEAAWRRYMEQAPYRHSPTTPPDVDDAQAIRRANELDQEPEPGHPAPPPGPPRRSSAAGDRQKRGPGR